MFLETVLESKMKYGVTLEYTPSSNGPSRTPIRDELHSTITDVSIKTGNDKHMLIS